MKTRQSVIYGIFAVIFALAFTACDGGGDLDLSGTITITPAGTAYVNDLLTANYTGTETVSYQWKRGSTNVGTNSRNFTPDQEGSYTVTVSAEGYNSKTSDAVTVTGNSVLSGDITITPAGPVTVNTQLTANYTGTETVSYQWKRGSTNVGTDATTYTPDQAGSYTVTVNATGYNSKTSAAVTVTEYWKITWNLDGGSFASGSNHPEQIEKGAVLAKPSPDPTKDGNTFDGWYANSGLTQTYNFTSPVTADLNLYAKWVQPPAGTPVSGNTLAEKLAWVLDENNVQDGQTYTIEVNADEEIDPHTLSYTSRSDITIILWGSGGEKIISLSQNGSLFTIGTNVTLELERNITLRGYYYNDTSLVRVNSGGELIMNTDVKISENRILTFSGGGVRVVNGTFTMNGGEISGNTASNGGGVYMGGGTFTMNGGEITGNTASNGSRDASSYGGGVYVGSGTFTMNDGKISGNTVRALYSTTSYGGGVYVSYNNNSSFTMNGGEISGNTASDDGSGAYVRGGGVYVASWSATTSGITITYRGIFRIVTGTIYGSNESDTNLRNTAQNGGSALYNAGTAQYGTFDGETWNSGGDLSTTGNTIKVVNGVLQQ